METSQAPLDLESVLKSDLTKRLTARVQWLDTHQESVTRTFLPSEPGFAYAPCEVGSEQPKIPVSLPSVQLHQFERAVISTQSSSVLLSDGVIVERVEGVDPALCDFVTGHLAAHNDSQAVITIRGAVIDVPRGVFMCGNGATNYYHFLIEILPRLRYLLEEPLFKNYPLLVDECVAREPNWREALDTASGGHPCLILPAHRSYRVGSLLYLSAPNAIPYNLRADVKLEVGYALTRPATVEFLRERFGVSGVSASASHHAHMPKRIFLARRPGGVRAYNQDEIAAVLESFGFVTMHMDALPVAQQARFMSNAEMVAGPSGAAWSNIAFCRPGAKCLCWNADRGFSAFCNLAHAAGADLKYLFVDHNLVSTRELYRLDYRLDPEAVRRAIQQLGG